MDAILTPSAPDAVFQVLAGVLRELCHEDLPGLAPATRIDEIAGIDSLRLLQAVAMLEESFAVEVDIAALHRLRCVQDIVDAVSAAMRGP